MKSWLIWKYPDAGKDWGQEEKGMTEDEMVGWHHRHNGHGFGWTPGVGDGQGGLACCGSWGHKESDMTERLNWTHPPKITTIIMSILWKITNVLLIVLLRPSLQYYCMGTKNKEQKNIISSHLIIWLYATAAKKKNLDLHDMTLNNSPRTITDQRNFQGKVHSLKIFILKHRNS